MEQLTIAAASRESAHELYAALERFHAELVESDEGDRIVVTFGGGDREIVDLLNAIEDYVTDRGKSPARIKLNDRDYTVHPR